MTFLRLFVALLVVIWTRGGMSILTEMATIKYPGEGGPKPVSHGKNNKFGAISASSGRGILVAQSGCCLCAAGASCHFFCVAFGL